MNYELRKVQEADVKDKTVFLRVDLDVPIEKSKIKNQKSKIGDDSRLEAWFPTLEYLLKQNAKAIIAGHLGRPKKQFSILNSQFSTEEKEFSLEPIAEWISKEFRIQSSESRIINVNGFEGWEITDSIILLENLRFYKEEEENNEEFAKRLASLADIYINDAFASSHRAHASIVGITKYIPSYAGLRLQKEIEELSEVLNNPKRPLTIIIGGAKIETKLPLVEKMHHFADYVLVGGEIAENDKVLAKVAHEKLNPPSGGKKSVLLVADSTADKKDITGYSAQNFAQVINASKTIVWNGPVGLVEERFDLGSKEIAKAIAISKAHTVVGGGDTVAFLQKEGLLFKFSFVSTGGGAMLEFLSGDKLPGLEALKQTA